MRGWQRPGVTRSGQNSPVGSNNHPEVGLDGMVKTTELLIEASLVTNSESC